MCLKLGVRGQSLVVLTLGQRSFGWRSSAAGEDRGGRMAVGRREEGGGSEGSRLGVALSLVTIVPR